MMLHYSVTRYFLFLVLIALFSCAKNKGIGHLEDKYGLEVGDDYLYEGSYQDNIGTTLLFRTTNDSLLFEVFISDEGYIIDGYADVKWALEARKLLTSRVRKFSKQVACGVSMSSGNSMEITNPVVNNYPELGHFLPLKEAVNNGIAQGLFVNVWMFLDYEGNEVLTKNVFKEVIALYREYELPYAQICFKFFSPEKYPMKDVLSLGVLDIDEFNISQRKKAFSPESEKYYWVVEGDMQKMHNLDSLVRNITKNVYNKKTGEWISVYVDKKRQEEVVAKDREHRKKYPDIYPETIFDMEFVDVYLHSNERKLWYFIGKEKGNVDLEVKVLPADTAKTIKKIAKFDTLNVVQDGWTWYKVRFSPNKVGYVKKDRVLPNNRVYWFAKGANKKNTYSLAYKQPKEKSEIVHRYIINEVVGVVKYGKEWTKVLLPNKSIAYIKTNDLKVWTGDENAEYENVEMYLEMEQSKLE